MPSEHAKLDAITNLGVELSRVKDLDILMEHILKGARWFVNADAGSIYIRKGDLLDFTYTQNDTLQGRLQKGEKLIYSTFSMPIDGKSIAGHVAVTGESMNITDAYKIDPALPYHFDKHFDETTHYRTQSVLTLPLKNSRSEILGILQIINAQDESKNVVPFSEKDEKMMSHFGSIAAVALERAQLTRAILLRMIRMAQMRDPKETGPHVNRVAGYSVELYEKWALKHGLTQKEIDETRDSLRMAAMLHDAGKVGIADAILKKPGPFTDQEREIMKQHAFLGARLFHDVQSDFDDAARLVALNHHERWDGKGGYPGHIDTQAGNPLEGFAMPDGSPKPKKGPEIPIFGRIVALADVYDALISARVYKDAWDESKALAIIREESGHQFDPELVEIFFASLDLMHHIRERFSEE